MLLPHLLLFPRPPFLECFGMEHQQWLSIGRLCSISILLNLFEKILRLRHICPRSNLCKALVSTLVSLIWSSWCDMSLSRLLSHPITFHGPQQQSVQSRRRATGACAVRVDDTWNRWNPGIMPCHTMTWSWCSIPCQPRSGMMLMPTSSLLLLQPCHTCGPPWSSRQVCSVDLISEIRSNQSSHYHTSSLL